MPKPGITDDVRTRIRNQAGFLLELELLEVLEDCEVTGFSFIIKKKDGLGERFEIDANLDKAVFELRKKFFQGILNQGMKDYKQHIEERLKGLM